MQPPPTTATDRPHPEPTRHAAGGDPTEGVADGGPVLHPGLEGIVLGTTRLSRVDGARGELVLAGFPIEEIAPRASFEQAAWLLMTGELPTDGELSALRRALARRRRLNPAVGPVLAAAAARRLEPMAVLPLAAATLALAGDEDEGRPGGAADADALPFTAEELAILAGLPRLLAAYARLRVGERPVDEASDASNDWGTAGDLLFALTGEPPSDAAVRALDTYLVTVADHGVNASTFTARVIISTGAGTLEAILGALGALSGPLHGGAPGPALDMVKAIGAPDRAEEALRARLAAGERLMGFGHRVYKVRDPRAEVLSRAAEALYSDPQSGADLELYRLTRHVEEVAVRLLDEHKPGRRLRANVELYTALLLDGLGLDSALFTPIFACARAAGWLAHGREQRREGRLIRPRLHYVGPVDRRWPM